MMSPESILPFFVALPLAGAFLICMLGKRFKQLPDILGNLVTLLLLTLSVLSVFLLKQNGALVYKVGSWGGNPPLGIIMALDGLSVFMLVTVNLVAFTVSLYSINYMERFTAKWQFYALFLLMLAGFA